jgi:hypothetical protein
VVATNQNKASVYQTENEIKGFAMTTDNFPNSTVSIAGHPCPTLGWTLAAPTINATS